MARLGEDQRDEDDRLRQHGAPVAVVERIEHDAMPHVQQEPEAEIHHRKREHRDRQEPGRASGILAPEAQSRLPIPCEEILPGVLVVDPVHRSPFFLPFRAPRAQGRANGCTVLHHLATLSFGFRSSAV